MKKHNKKNKWINCLFCKYINQCITGQARIQGLTERSPIALDVGCFDYEVYLAQYKNSKQLKLF